jgi:mannose-1-phosphate guanylyltransferase
MVLAGGDGVRTKEFIRRWLGYEKPKQYCTFVGSRSMFQHTLDRAARLLQPKNVEQPEEEFRCGPKRSCTSRAQ